ncbi:MAG: AbrB/MazE/SpoVT family DNA-binding domain-containing protein [Candidatus Aenigmatarchaeota archaeon]
MNNQKSVENGKRGRIRTVAVNERGQIVIPEDIRKELGIGKSATLVLIENGDEIVIRKEGDVLSALGEDAFWKTVVRKSMKRAWNKEDDVWDEIARKDMNE